MAKTKKLKQPTTPAQRLDSIVKSARKIMRKDKGLNGELDRLPMLTWIMFLKFLDDLERMHADEAELAGKKFIPAIDSPYRWRDWAAQKDGLTGPDLIRFLTAEELTLPNGKKGAGLFTYLRGLRGRNGGRDRRDVIATVFRGLSNRMESGYLLRDVINLIDGIHFNSSEEIHTLSRLYEGLLREMRDSAGDSGEFYTPRPVIRFMVEVVNPKLGEVVLDPACGTGGFLAEAYVHLERQAKTVEQRKVLQQSTLKGVEPKSLPYMLCEMNLLLHGLEAPDIDPGNALRFRLNEMGERERVDVILTNPPFGGEEEAGILTNFPDDKRTSETALLFLQLIMRRLKRSGKGRAGVVVPESVMSDAGVAQRIRQQLVEELHLHTIIRLPKGVFEPYSDIQTNLLFFDTNKTTSGVWFYEHALSDERREMRDPRYTTTSPLKFEELIPALDWFRNQKENERSWHVPVEEIQNKGFSFDFRNPRQPQRQRYSLPDLVANTEADLVSAAHRLSELKQKVVSAAGELNTVWPRVSLREILENVRVEAAVEAEKTYKQITVKLYGKGVVLRGESRGGEIKTRPQFIAHADDLIMSRIDARNGAFGLIPEHLDGALVTQDFPMFRISSDRIQPEFLALILKSDSFVDICKRASRGTTNRKRLKEEPFLAATIPLPNLEQQVRLIEIASAAAEIEACTRAVGKKLGEAEKELHEIVWKEDSIA